MRAVVAKKLRKLAGGNRKKYRSLKKIYKKFRFDVNGEIPF